MKNIEIEISFFKHEKQKIHLGNCEWLEFKSKTFAKKYISTYKKVLLENVRILNSYHLQAYIIYRTYYFDLDSKTNSRVEGGFNDFTKSYGMIFNKYSSGNQNGFMFHRVESTLSILMLTVLVIKRHAQKHKNYSIKHSSNTLLKMISDLMETIEKQKRDLNLSRAYAENSLSIVEKERNESA